MKTLTLILILISATLCLGQSTWAGSAIYSAGPGPVPASLFGIHFSLTRDVGLGPIGIPWVTVSAGSIRLWDTGTTWLEMNPSSGVYNFSSLDLYLAAAKSHGMRDILLTLSGTPAWASSDATNTSCDYGSASGLAFLGNGSCGPPIDLNSDGTGANQHWRDFIFALGTHINGLSVMSSTKVTSFEIWNEFSRGGVSGSCGPSASTISWEGTCAQLVRLAQDANCILTGRGTITATSQTCTAGNMLEPAVGLNPSAKVTTPDAVPELPDLVTIGTYLSTSGALSSVDAIAVHAYSFQGIGTTGPDPVIGGASSLPTEWAGIGAQLPGTAFGLDIWSTEGSWGPSPVSSSIGYIPDPDMQMGYMARYFLLGWSSGFRRLYWYADNNSYGRLVYQWGEMQTSPTPPYGPTSACGNSNNCPVLNAAGFPIQTAWNSVYQWMVGAELVQQCSLDATATIYTCTFVNGSTTQIAAWTPVQGTVLVSGTTYPTCSPNSPVIYTVPGGYGHYRRMEDNAALPLGATVNLTCKPILLIP